MRFKLFISYLCVFISLVAGETLSGQFLSPSEQAKSLEILPISVQRFIVFEQKFNPRVVDTKRFLAPSAPQNSEFAPEAGNVFFLDGFWLPSDWLLVQRQLRSYLRPDQNEDIFKQYGIFHRFGPYDYKQKTSLFFFHPESSEHYKDLIAWEPRRQRFYATPTSSSRTMLVWNDEGNIFFVKCGRDEKSFGILKPMNMYFMATNVNAANEIATRKELAPEASELDFFDEVILTSSRMTPFGASDDGSDPNSNWFANGHGFVIRALPRTLRENNGNTLMPLFSLAAINPNTDLPLIAEMIERSGMKKKEFIVQKFLKPFAEVWSKMLLRHKMVGAVHGQNALLEVDTQDNPTGRFVFRDFTDFYFPSHFESFVEGMNRSLYTFFAGGVLYPISRALIDSGYMKSARYTLLERWFLDEVEISMTELLGQKVEIKHSYQIQKILGRVARLKYGKAKQGELCDSLFGAK